MQAYKGSKKAKAGRLFWVKQGRCFDSVPVCIPVRFMVYWIV